MDVGFSVVRSFLCFNDRYCNNKVLVIFNLYIRNTGDLVITSMDVSKASRKAPVERIDNL